MKSIRQAKLAAVLLTLSLLAAAVPANAQNAQPALPRGVTRVTSVEGITEYRLENGLQVLLFPDSSKQTLTVNITYLVGSKHENYGESGMAHLLEHLVFKGTPTHPNIPEELNARGAQFNGTTWLDRTNYYEILPANDDNLEWALKFEADRMVNSFIAKKDLDSEMTVVRNEFELGENSPHGVLLDRVTSMAYIWHNYGNPSIGARSDLENVPIDRLQNFYRTYYQPDNAVLLVAGKFDEGKALQIIADSFGKIPRPTRKLPQFYTEEPVQDGERSVTLRRVGDVKLAAAAYHVPAGSHPDFAAIDILTKILGDSPSGRLYKALVETQKASTIFAFSFQMRDPSLVIFALEARKEAPIEPARDGLVEVIENIANTEITKEEVERARTALLKQIELSLNSSEQVGVQLSEWAAMGDWRLLFLYRDQLKKVTPEDVKRVAAAYLKQSNRTLGVFIPTEKPDRAEIPPTPDVAEMLKDYKSDTTIAVGEAFDPSPANIESRTVRPAPAGGLKLAFLPKKTRGETVNAVMVLHLGDEKSLMNRALAGEMVGPMLMRGTTKRTRQQIKDEFDRLKARVNISSDPAQAVVSIETVRANLPEVMKLVAEVLRQPSFPESEFTQLKQEMLTGIEQQLSEPISQAITAFRRHIAPYPKGDARYVPSLEEQVADIKALTLADVKKFYEDFYGASAAQLAVVGDFDDKEMAKLAGELFGDWKSRTQFARIASPYQEVPALNRTFETPDKANAFFVAGQNLAISEADPDYPAMVLANYLMGGGILNSRLANRIRQKEGLSYGVGSQFSARSFDRSGIWMAYAIYAPQNVAKIEAAFREEVERALKDGFTAEEIEKGKAGLLQGWQVERAQDGVLAQTLASKLYLNRTMAWDAELEARIKALTPEQVAAAMRKYLDPAKMTIIKAGDFKAATAKQ